MLGSSPLKLHTYVVSAHTKIPQNFNLIYNQCSKHIRAYIRLQTAPVFGTRMEGRIFVVNYRL